MAAAQHSMVEFCEAKLASLQGELVQAHGIIEALRKANMSDARGRRLVTGIKKREAFYVKIKAALAEGYYILPPIPHQTFAIRSAKEVPPPNRQVGNTWHVMYLTNPSQGMMWLEIQPHQQRARCLRVDYWMDVQ